LGVVCPSLDEVGRLDQRKRVACDCVPGEVVRGERRGTWVTVEEEEEEAGATGISCGGAFTGDRMAFGRTS
jgi:hypothetical protein